jgi:hypothetical protein
MRAALFSTVLSSPFNASINLTVVRIHQTLRVTPAMEAGVSDHVWSAEDIARLAA